jgi:hypothetical protein
MPSFGNQRGVEAVPGLRCRWRRPACPSSAGPIIPTSYLVGRGRPHEALPLPDETPDVVDPAAHFPGRLRSAVRSAGVGRPSSTRRSGHRMLQGSTSEPADARLADALGGPASSGSFAHDGRPYTGIDDAARTEHDPGDAREEREAPSTVGLGDGSDSPDDRGARIRSTSGSTALSPKPTRR